MDSIFQKLQQKRSALLSSWIPRREAGDWRKITPESEIAQENLLAALDFSRRIEEFLKVSGEKYCLLLHGSTAHGKGQIAPNIEHQIEEGEEPRMKTAVIPDCRDDLDLILLTDSPEQVKGETETLADAIFQRGIDITVNLLSWEHLWEELAHPHTPAFRRILNFNSPAVLLGMEHFEEIRQAAGKSESKLDISHEIDFRLLMRLAALLTAEGRNEYVFTAEMLLRLFPTFFLAGKERIHIGFPKKRIKIKRSFS